jgi:hypothetical protein
MFQRVSLSTIFSLLQRQEVGLGLYFTHGENMLLKPSSQIILEIRYTGDNMFTATIFRAQVSNLLMAMGYTHYHGLVCRLHLEK